MSKSIFVEEPVVEKKDSCPGCKDIPLPSNGKFGYPEEVTIRPLKVKDEKLISMADPNKFTQALNELLKNIIVGDTTWFGKMKIADRDVLLLTVFADNYNSVVTVTTHCPTCGEQETIKHDVLETDFDLVKDDVIDPMELTISSGDKITVSLTTVTDESIAQRNAKDQEDVLYYMLYASIKTINGKTLPYSQKVLWIEENMTARDLGLVKEYHKHFAYGLKPATHTCSACGEEVKYSVPLADIFLSTNEGDFESQLRAIKQNSNESD